jgi:hypothetical protein
VRDVGRSSPTERGHCEQDEEKGRFRVQEWADRSRHREPLNRTRRLQSERVLGREFASQRGRTFTMPGPIVCE